MSMFGEMAKLNSIIIFKMMFDSTFGLKTKYIAPIATIQTSLMAGDHRVHYDK